MRLLRWIRAGLSLEGAFRLRRNTVLAEYLEYMSSLSPPSPYSAATFRVLDRAIALRFHRMSAGIDPTGGEILVSKREWSALNCDGFAEMICGLRPVAI